MSGRIHYGWIVAAVTFLILLTGAGIRATPGVLMVPLERDFGWSTATISAAVAVNILLYGLIGPFAVAIFERHGLRRSVAGALLLLAGGVFATTYMTAPWQMMLLWGILVGSGTGMIANVLGATVANRWFTRHRGLVLGLLTASAATGQLVFLPLLARLAGDAGWRTAALTVAGAALALALPALLLLRDRPADLGLPRYGDTAVMPPPAPVRNPVGRALSALRQGFGSRDFWLLAATFFICGASTNGLIGTHMIPLCIDQGIPEVTAAGYLALMGLFDLIGTTASGWLTDRYDSRRLLFWYYALRGLSLMVLPAAFGYDAYGLTLFAVFYGLDWIATVPPTVRLAGESFGEENAALMFGWIAVSHQLGAAAAAWSTGLLRTGTGDYLPAFVAAGALCLAAAGLSLFIGRGKRAPHPAPAATA